jgi:hypothetical protein
MMHEGDEAKMVLCSFEAYLLITRDGKWREDDKYVYIMC